MPEIIDIEATTISESPTMPAPPPTDTGDLLSRHYLAACALPAVISAINATLHHDKDAFTRDRGNRSVADWAAEDAYLYADAMIERGRR